MNFDEMQDNLANWIGEAKDRNGTWTIVEKKRQINDACLEFVKKTKFLQWFQQQKSVENEPEYPLPEDYMNSVLLLSNGLKYRRESIEKHFFFTNGRKANVTGPYRYYYRDEVKNTMILNPAPEDDDLPINLLYIRKPNKLVEVDDESVIPEQFHQVPLYWAAYQMLPKEFEGNRRGRDALAGWDRGVAEALEYIHHEVDDNVNEGSMGPEFLRHSARLGRGDFDTFNTGGN